MLAYYGKALALDNRHNEAIQVYQRALRLGSQFYLNLNLGNSLENVGRYEEAEERYVVANNMIPNRIYQKYLLAKLYIRQDQQDNAKVMAKQILEMNEKIHSRAFQEIKIEMRQYLDQTN